MSEDQVLTEIEKEIPEYEVEQKPPTFKEVKIGRDDRRARIYDWVYFGTGDGLIVDRETLRELLEEIEVL